MVLQYKLGWFLAFPRAGLKFSVVSAKSATLIRLLFCFPNVVAIGFAPILFVLMDLCLFNNLFTMFYWN